ncbi:trophoblast glycoprotein [Sitodiplosis mosellana]|uniref:trophoblast glycoprotein n=1 Tax=Sitodiplosis mosellana TaxID=263140 RepID=UPI002444A68F|nr:trophoblast glycoprotein [Sitodiplosis mosellana]XP_055316959.1 trophoblast glycoprotein [Sitodiplosis mosellana]XP_055316960.1 trophoblast glycoprotein [Sitodiplosis mosellana]XP_055316961.1 trophoblast glycoprotein [Sitodiplosis mosellana]XP_055316962.1 trophoblast glycoprotein [Sitodiplosis mosellana]XP_055316964.1 trophoblast glycoprotein [Sitodiplosis mosellana]XP_055316965.1 trophoblast glycoprotein [Sitodiplosis mosellana]XP_055316966.1 trophoblast glycoprotein [Sitodiplosis mosell
MNRRCMLIILLLCVLKISQSDDLTGDELTDNDYTYDDENESSKETTVPIVTEVTASIPNTSEISAGSITTIELATLTPIEDITTLSTIPIETTTQELEESKCPKGCKCSEVFKSVDCSHQKLVQIPKNLPHNTVQLNLSHNLLTTLNVSDLIKYSELQQLTLNDNQIETIVNTYEFSQLPNLEHIDLSSNVLKPLHGTEFSKARKLTTLFLTGNKNVIASNVPIVQYKLKTLNLANCSITQLSDNIFQNLSTLVSLYLENNPLDSALNVKAFKYLVNLRVMNLPTLSRDVVPNLCKELGSIDIIHLTQETYDISCFLLTSGSTFDESIIVYGQPTLSSFDIDSNDLYKDRTTLKPQRKKTTAQKPVIATMTKETKESAVVEPASSQKISTFSQETKTEKAINGTDSTEKDDTKQAKVDVPQHIIYMLLIGLIAVTLVALLIGVFCRLDCCGIKTKCCRRHHNRAETEDRVQPHEEIPLNKV